MTCGFEATLGLTWVASQREVMPKAVLQGQCYQDSSLPLVVKWTYIMLNFCILLSLELREKCCVLNIKLRIPSAKY